MIGKIDGTKKLSVYQVVRPVYIVQDGKLGEAPVEAMQSPARHLQNIAGAPRDVAEQVGVILCQSDQDVAAIGRGTKDGVAAGCERSLCALQVFDRIAGAIAADQQRPCVSGERIVERGTHACTKVTWWLFAQTNCAVGGELLEQWMVRRRRTPEFDRAEAGGAGHGYRVPDQRLVQIRGSFCTQPRDQPRFCLSRLRRLRENDNFAGKYHFRRHA